MWITLATLNLNSGLVTEYDFCMVIACGECGWSKDVPVRVGGSHVRYRCQTCRKPVTSVSVFGWAEWIEALADKLEVQRRGGRLGTRKQSTKECDRDISAAGLGAELAACMILCPWKTREWMKQAVMPTSNRGYDLPAQWFADGRSVEVKYTACRGHLLVRPPRNTPGKMLSKYVDDSIYILMTGSPYTFAALGWAGRSDILKRGRLNPIPCRGRQRECWGIHADELNLMSSVFSVLGSSRRAVR